MKDQADSTGQILGGGIIGDEPGLGKTASMFTMAVLSHQLNLAWAEFNDARSKKLFNIHLPKFSPHKPQPPDATCPLFTAHVSVRDYGSRMDFLLFHIFLAQRIIRRLDIWNMSSGEYHHNLQENIYTTPYQRVTQCTLRRQDLLRQGV